MGRQKNEVFFLNLEDGYFGCQVNESTDYLQLFELSRICDGRPDCYMGSDEQSKELRCTDDCSRSLSATCADGSVCTNGACLDSQCHCNDGYGGCNCQVPGKSADQLRFAYATVLYDHDNNYDNDNNAYYWVRVVRFGFPAVVGVVVVDVAHACRFLSSAFITAACRERTEPANEAKINVI